MLCRLVSGRLGWKAARALRAERVVLLLALINSCGPCLEVRRERRRLTDSLSRQTMDQHVFQDVDGKGAEVYAGHVLRLQPVEVDVVCLVSFEFGQALRMSGFRG